MANTLTNLEVQEILTECQQQERLIYTAKGEKLYQLPKILGEGYWQNIELYEGLQLTILNLSKRHHHLHKIEQHSPQMPLTSSFYLAGNCRVTNEGIKKPQEEIAGKNYLYCLPSTAEIEEYLADQKLNLIRISISPDLFQTLISHQFSELSWDIKSAIAAPSPSSLLYRQSVTTTAMQSLLKQLLNCPYQGITRQFFLQSKVLELLGLQLAQINQNQSIFSQNFNLNRSDLERIYYAQEILISNINQPPSLIELARQVNLNERKLKQGFRDVFGTTVFGYLYQYRMEQAQQLLLQGQMTVQDVASQVGYASRSSFVAAFKKKFQVSPSHFQGKKSR
jgi:AraC-like DNA-binding protein